MQVADCPEGFGAQVMLDLAGVFAGDILGDSDLGEEVGEHLVAGVDAVCNLHSGCREGNHAVALHDDVSVLAEALRGIGDARLGDSQKLGDVD